MIPLLEPRVLTNSEIEQIHQAVLTILGRTGIQVEHRTMRERLADYEAGVAEQRVRFPAPLVEDFLLGSVKAPLPSFPTMKAQAGVYQGPYPDPSTG
ncbi:MAG: hypothetical protein ACP5HS_13415 [Anaerolineae bacterium]